MKSVKDTLLTRRSIRRYEREKIEQNRIDFIFEAIRNTQTSYNGQQFTVIATTDQQIKEQLYVLTGQKQIKTSALFMVFCVDFNKLKIAAQAKGVEPREAGDRLDAYTVAVIDASLAMQNAVIAAESLGLGTCCIGYARTANPYQIAQLLKLPQGVAVVCGLAIGYPAEMPDMKPKLPLSLVIHTDHYRDDGMSEDLLAYDSDVQRYNAARSGEKTSNDWVNHIMTYKDEKHDSVEYLTSQGIGL